MAVGALAMAVGALAIAVGASAAGAAVGWLAAEGAAVGALAVPPPPHAARIGTSSASIKSSAPNRLPDIIGFLLALLSIGLMLLSTPV